VERSKAENKDTGKTWEGRGDGKEREGGHYITTHKDSNVHEICFLQASPAGKAMGHGEKKEGGGEKRE